MVAVVVQLSCARAARADGDVRARLEDTLGAARRREAVSDACFAIIDRLTRFEVAAASARRGEAAALARSIAAISEGIGLPELCRAALAAAECMTGTDPVARGATERRLTSLGEASLDALLGSLRRPDN